HGVTLVLAHVLEFPRLDISQTDVFHDNLRIFCDSASRSSSFCYQIVVRETENRQLLHFFSVQLPKPLLQECPLWFLLGQRQSILIRGPNFSGRWFSYFRKVATWALKPQPQTNRELACHIISGLKEIDFAGIQMN